ncbi:hypothetical protein VPHK459_0096 [Vibrio phage K459]
MKKCYRLHIDYATVFRNASTVTIRYASFRIWLRVTGGRV